MSTRTRFAAAFAATVTLLPAASSVAGTKAFTGDLCSTLSASTIAAPPLNISGTCVRGRTKTYEVSTPLGSIRTVSYWARWGSPISISAPKSTLSIGVTYASGSSAAIAYVQQHFRGEVLANGTPFSAKPLATDAEETTACHNPPTGDCTRGEIMALVRHYGVTIAYAGPTDSVAQDDPQHPSVDKNNDLAQEKDIRGPLIGVAQAVMSAL
jgi:hypothetical protein